MKVELDIKRGAIEAKGSLVLPIGGSLEDYAEFTRRYLDCKAVIVKFCDCGPVAEDGKPSTFAVASVSEHDTPAGGGPVDAGELADPVAASRLGYGFYAGLPLYLDSGERLGMLAAVDAKPRKLTGDQMATLKLLAAIIVQTVSFRLAVAEPEARRVARS